MVLTDRVAFIIAFYLDSGLFRSFSLLFFYSQLMFNAVFFSFLSLIQMAPSVCAVYCSDFIYISCMSGFAKVSGWGKVA